MWLSFTAQMLHAISKSIQVHNYRTALYLVSTYISRILCSITYYIEVHGDACGLACSHLQAFMPPSLCKARGHPTDIRPSAGLHSAPLPPTPKSGCTVFNIAELILLQVISRTMNQVQSWPLETDTNVHEMSYPDYTVSRHDDDRWRRFAWRSCQNAQ